MYAPQEYVFPPKWVVFQIVTGSYLGNVRRPLPKKHPKGAIHPHIDDNLVTVVIRKIGLDSHLAPATQLYLGRRDVPVQVYFGPGLLAIINANGVLLGRHQ